MGRKLCYILTTAVLLVGIVSLLMLSVDLTASDMDFYRAEYRKLKRPAAIGISEDELMRVSEHLIGYMRGSEEDLRITARIDGKDREVFGKRERDHMVDVRNLYVFFLWFMRIGLALCVVWGILLVRWRRRSAARIAAHCFLFAAGIFALVIGAMAIWVAVDFSSFWTAFHHLFFTNDLWQLDPATSVLIQMVPQEFFFDMVVRIISVFAAMMGVGLALAIGSMAYRRYREKSLLAIRIYQTGPEAVIERYARANADDGIHTYEYDPTDDADDE